MDLAWILFLLVLRAVPGESTAPVELTAAADLAGWIEHRTARALLPPLRSGRPADLFDGDPDTWVRCGEEGRAAFTFLLPRPMPVIQVGIRLAGTGIYRWSAAWANPARPGGDAAFRPLSAPRYVEGGAMPDMVRLPAGITASRLRFTVEHLTLGPELLVAELLFYTRIPVAGLRLRAPPERVLLAGGTVLRPEAVDAFGGVLPLDRGVRWEVTPPELARIALPARLLPRAAGRFRVRFRFLGKHSPWYAVEAVPPAPPPGRPRVRPFPTTAYVSFAPPPSPTPGFALYLRRDGEPPPPDPIRRFTGTACTVWGLEPDTAYHAAVAGLDARGRPVTTRSGETRFRTLPGKTPGLTTTARLQVLVPVYTDAFTPAELDALKRGFAHARTFFFRSTGARLDVALEVLHLQGPPPSGGPGMTAAAEDLARRDACFPDHDAIHAVTGERGRNLSGHLFPGGVVGSMGSGADAVYPSTDPAAASRACWTLVHELQHTLMLFSRRSPGGPALASGHFLDPPSPPGDAAPPIPGPFYAGERAVLARYPAYLTLPTPLRARVEAEDEDGDGLPDADPRLPADEARFGSDPGERDTDGDGLDDLEEFRAGIYAGTDPRRPDTDGDGLPDGIDPYPLNDFSGVIPRATPRPGAPPPGRLAAGVYFAPRRPAPAFRVHAAWDPGHLYLCFASDRPLSIAIHLDGSGHLGPFASDRKIPPRGDTGPAGSDVYTREATLHVTFGEERLLRGAAPVPGACVRSLERKDEYRLWVAVPADLGPGTAACRIPAGARVGRGPILAAGRILGLAFTLLPADPDAGEGAGAPLPAYAFEPHRFLHAVLVDRP